MLGRLRLVGHVGIIGEVYVGEVVVVAKHGSIVRRFVDRGIGYICGRWRWDGIEIWMGVGGRCNI